MNKQLEKIQQINVSSEDELNNLLNEDVSGCCPRKKRKAIMPLKPVVALPTKRPSTSSGFANAQPPTKKIAINPPSKTLRPPIQNLQTYRTSPVAAKTRTPPKASNNEIVCTPDIMGLFNDNDDNSIPTTNMMPSTTLAPPPLVMRNNPRLIRPALTPTPIYHNVNGYQIDLNHAARQEIFRLPNGKLIQVRKQTAPPIPGPFRPGLTPRGPQFTIRQANPAPVPMQTTTARMFRPQVAQPRSVRPTGPQQRFSFTDGRIVPANSSPQAPTPPTPAPVLPPSASTVFTQQNGSISVARAPQPNTPFGTSKVEFEDKIISGMEICQHTINKMITLTNSTSFKTSRSFSDLKDLYIHLQYLFTYTSGKFKTLQESLTTGMESLAKHDSALKEKDDADELEIVEEKQDVIEVLSDDEEPVVSKKKPGPASATLLTLLKQPTFKNPEDNEATTSTEESTAKAAEVESIGEAASSEAPMTQIPGAEREAASEGAATSSGIRLESILSNDKKLSNKVVVKVEKLEDSKNPIIKEILNRIQEREEMQTSDESSCDGSPDITIDLNVVREEGDKEPAAIEVINASAAKVDEGPQEDGENVEEPVENADDKTLEKETVEKAEEPSESATTEEAVKEPAAEVNEVFDIASDDDDELMEPAEKILSELSSKSDMLKIDTTPPDELMEVDEREYEKANSVAEDDKLESIAEAEEVSVEKTTTAEEQANESAEKSTQETMSANESAEKSTQEKMSANEIPASPNNFAADMNGNKDNVDNADIIEISSQDSTVRNDTSIIEVSSQDSNIPETTESNPDQIREKATLNGFAESPDAENGSEFEIDEVLGASEIPDTEAMLNDMKTIENNLSSDDITKITEHDINSLIDTLGEEPTMDIDEAF